MLFHFKQFNVDQSGCAMKINTDGVLLGALAGNGKPNRILDIGTGTGVIAMMMSQRFPAASIDAVEIDAIAANTAGSNFKDSIFADRLNIHAIGFEEYFEINPEKEYDLIISNPPFYINSLAANSDMMNLAKHAGKSFFDALMNTAAKQLSPGGTCCLVLPLETSALVKELALQQGLFVVQQINIHSFAHSGAHREIIALSKVKTKFTAQQFVIYDAVKVYSQQYQGCLKDFFTIF